MTSQEVVSFAPNAAFLLQFLSKQRSTLIYEVTLESGERVQFERERPFSSVEEGREYLKERFGWTWNSKHWIASSAQEEEMVKFFDDRTNEK